MLHICTICNLFLSLLLLPPFYAQAQDKDSKNSVSLNKSINNNYTPAGPVFNTEIKPVFNTTTTSIIHAVGVKVGDITVLIHKMVRETMTKENYESLKSILKQLLWKNRYKIAGGTLVGSYSATSLLLITHYHQLRNSVFWGHWKHESSFEELCIMPQKELAKELLLAIGEHHYNKDNPTDLAYPLVTFIKEIDWEIGIIKQYITIAKTIKKLHLMAIFPTNEKKLEMATKMLERSLFIKHIFLSWLADYNLANTAKING